jgi:hypothetical protein
MPMQADWIDAIFVRLGLAYGARFVAQWEGMPSDAVKTTWGHTLDGIGSRGIAHALAHLNPDFPPNAMQFRALCLAAPGLADTTKRLEGPAVTPASVARLAAAVAPLRKPIDPKAWAHALKAREEGGEHLSRFQREAWRQALGRNTEASKDAAYSEVMPEVRQQPGENAHE